MNPDDSSTFHLDQANEITSFPFAFRQIACRLKHQLDEIARCEILYMRFAVNKS